ncbi:MAG: ATP-dependent Clp protease proteolytic subunit [Fuerstiella sp.]|nr:ATP-dependent Clp protease proteolytic subunit [Fuerstiella sp.]
MARSKAVRLKPYPVLGQETGFPIGDRGSWEVCITGELSEKQTELLGRLTEFPAGSRGIIWFDSCGGSVYAGLAVASVIRIRGLMATGVVLGECSSAALIPFAACRKRFVTPLSTLLFHPMRWQSEEDVRLEEAAEWARHFRHLETRLDNLLEQLFPISAEALEKWNNPGRFVDGPELAESGLAELIDPFHADDCWKRIRSA